MMIDDFKFLRQNEQEVSELPGSEIIDLGELDVVKKKDDALVIDLPDGSISINLGGFSLSPSDDAKDHDANLANHVDNGTLEGISSDLLRLIGDDLQRQEQRLSDIVKGVELLGVKLEEPRSEPNEEGISVIRHPLLLEAVLRFQANARGELLPSDGPVKVSNEGDNVLQLDEQAEQLESDFNHYLTSGAPEYYADTDRMFFSLGLNGEAYRKIYYHPLKRRPVVETIDRKDIILSDGAVSLEACSRVTHRSRIRPSIVKQMQLAGAWRNVNLSSGASIPDLNKVDKKLSDLAGIQPNLQVGGMDETDHEIYECYCELDLRGFEHKEDGEETGLALPYRVTIDKDSRQILEIRRWWEEDDKSYVRKEVFVEYIFVPAFPGVNLGLLQILGNASRALTAAWRIALDNGMLANFPGGIMARSTGKQQTTNIRVGPGQIAPLDVDGVPLNQAFMPLPYRDVTSGFLNIIQNIETVSNRVGMMAEVAVGEGRQDAPVGTTIALIDQATKVISAVHKRMHTSQAKEFALLKELFRRDPEALWRSNKNPNFQGDVERLQAALDNRDIVPKADPNTASQSMRINKAIAIYTLAQQNPAAFDMQAVYERVMSMVGVEDGAALFSKTPPGPPQPDQTKMLQAQAQMVAAQAKMQETQVKAQNAQIDAQTKMAQVQTQNIDAITKRQIAKTDAINHAEDRNAKLRLEGMKLQQSAMVHGDKLNAEERRHGRDLEQNDLHKGLDLENALKIKALDQAHSQRQQSMDLAHEAQQTAAQQLHDVALANQEGELAERAQFMKPEKGE